MGVSGVGSCVWGVRGEWGGVVSGVGEGCVMVCGVCNGLRGAGCVRRLLGVNSVDQGTLAPVVCCIVDSITSTRNDNDEQ